MDFPDGPQRIIEGRFLERPDIPEVPEACHEREMHVRFDESRQDSAPFEIDDAGAASCSRRNGFLVADGQDLACVYRQRRILGKPGVNWKHDAIAKNDGIRNCIICRVRAATEQWQTGNYARTGVNEFTSTYGHR